MATTTDFMLNDGTVVTVILTTSIYKPNKRGRPDKTEIVISSRQNPVPVAVGLDGKQYSPEDGVVVTKGNGRIYGYAQKGGYTVRVTSPVARVRLKRGLTQKELAERSGIPTITIQRIEEGSGVMHTTTAQKIAQALNCSADDII
ncbi:hypothetical protein AGMMS49975_24950 [Clostridia bacterium]|nr:hypothetical protein AGMMS49975_18020 [Clostridia bacterium]GHU58391.1 hypothetical protein AGMMS49975_24950 [Clostridia bacterium]